MWDVFGIKMLTQIMSNVARDVRTSLNLLHSIQERQLSMSQAVDDLVAEVADLKTVADGENLLLDKLFALVQAAINTGDLAKVQQAVNDLKADKQTMIDATLRNTPAQP